MEVRLALDPRLEIDGETFAAAWRENPANLALGSFTVDPSSPRTFTEPSIILTFISGVAVGALPNALWDGIKWTCQRLSNAKRKSLPELVFQHVKQPDGTEITLLRLKE